MTCANCQCVDECICEDAGCMQCCGGGDGQCGKCECGFADCPDCSE